MCCREVTKEEESLVLSSSISIRVASMTLFLSRSLKSLISLVVLVCRSSNLLVAFASSETKRVNSIWVERGKNSEFACIF